MRPFAVAATLMLALLAAPAAAAEAAPPPLDTLPGTAWWTDPASGDRMVAADASVPARDLRRLASRGVTVVREAGTRRGYIAGGDAIVPANLYRCTVGFNARSASDPNDYYFVTSGHCVGPVGSTVSVGNQVIGTVFQRTNPQDLALVRYTRTTSIAHPSAVNRYDGTLQPITAFAGGYVGQPVQRSGSTTGLRGGTITALNVTVNYAEGSVHGLIRTTVCAEPGDSGGPLFSTTTGLGVTSGGSGNCTSGGVSYFAPVAQYLAARGLTAF